MRTLLGMTTLALLTITAGVRAEDTKPATETSKTFDDKTFVMKAASGGMMEVELGKIAAKNASDLKVKAFAEKMVTDHSKANEKLKTVAADSGYRIEAKLMAEHQKHVEHFREMKGASFDAEYVKHMVKDHEEDVALFRRAAGEAQNKDLAAFAKESLPTLEEHLAMAKKLHESLGGTSPRREK